MPVFAELNIYFGLAHTGIQVAAIPAAVMYFLMSWPLSIITRRIEVRMQLGKNP